MTSFYIETYGDGPYSADSEYMAGLLQQARFEYKEKLEEADIVILNTCPVKTPLVDALLHRLDEIKKGHPYKIILITGCIPQAELERFKNFTVVGTRQIHHIVEAVEETLHNNIVKMLETGEMPPLNLPKIRKNKFLEIIPIGREGASGLSSKNKPGAKKIDSYSTINIVNVATKAVKEGVKEIWLTSPDTAGYGLDIGKNLPDLLKELLQIPGDFKIRLDKCNPAYLKKIKDDLFPLFADEKMVKYIYIPIVSGSNAVLKQMGLEYTKEECTSLVQELWRIEPHLTLMTNITVGHPTETEDDFWKTLNLLRFLNPDTINISRFLVKPTTSAASWPEEEVQRRLTVLTEIYQNISTLRNERWKGWEGTIIINEKGTSPNQWIGRNEYHKPVLVEGEYKIGDGLKIRIVKTGTFELWGEVVEKS